MGNKDKKVFAENVAQDPDLQKKICSRAEEIEGDITAGRRGKGKMISGGRTRVGTFTRVGTRSETPQGVFWPEAIYKLPEHCHVKVDRKQKTHRIDEVSGKKVVGIILDSKLGCPDGCTRIIKTVDSMADRTVDLFDSNATCRAEAGDELFGVASAAVTLTTKRNKKKKLKDMM